MSPMDRPPRGIAGALADLCCECHRRAGRITHRRSPSRTLGPRASDQGATAPTHRRPNSTAGSPPTHGPRDCARSASHQP